jgi:hypothetical protein
VVSIGALIQVSSRSGALGVAINSPRARKGEAQISSDQINRFSAGAAKRKILCPPVSCVGCITQPGREFAFWHYSWTFGREGRTTKPCKTSFASCASTLPAYGTARLGYSVYRQTPYSESTLPETPGCDVDALKACGYFV